MPRPISAIAADVRREWKNVYFGAVPYLEAMADLTDKSSRYYEDSATSVVSYFLANASTFRGPAAKALKLELKGVIK